MSRIPAISPIGCAATTTVGEPIHYPEFNRLKVARERALKGAPHPPSTSRCEIVGVLLVAFRADMFAIISIHWVMLTSSNPGQH